MTITKQSQYGVLFVLYLYRAGRATVSTVSQALRLSNTFLVQVAAKLRIAGIVKSIRGAGGGYEVVGLPTVQNVFTALGEKDPMSQAILQSYSQSDFEKRAFSQYFKLLNATNRQVLLVPIKSLGTSLVDMEMRTMEKVSPEGVAH